MAASRPDKLNRLADGLMVDGVKYGPIEAAYRFRAALQYLDVHEPARRQEPRNPPRHGSLAFPVTRLIRVAYGPFQLGTLPRGCAEEVNGKILREQVPGLGK